MQATERMIHKVSVADEAVFDYEELVGAQPPIRDIKQEVETYLNITAAWARGYYFRVKYYDEAIDRMLFVLFLLMHHGPVLPAGHAAVLGSCAVAVLGDVTTGGEEVTPTISASAGRMTVMHPIHQIKAVELHRRGKVDPLYKHHLFFIPGIVGKDVGGCDNGRDRKGLDLRHRQLLHPRPEVVAVETVVGGHGKIGLRPLFQPTQISRLEVLARGSEVIDSQWNAIPCGQITEKELSDRRGWIQQVVVRFWGEHDLQRMKFPSFVQQVIWRTSPQGIQHFFQGSTHLGQQLDECILFGLGQRLHQITDFPAVSNHFPQSLIVHIQKFGGKIPGRIRAVLKKYLILPDIQRQTQEMVVLLNPWRHGHPHLVSYLFSLCLAILTFYQNSENNQVEGQFLPEKALTNVGAFSVFGTRR